MYTVLRTEAFADWLNGLNDRSTRLRLVRRLERAERGILGDVSSIGDGVKEMREHFGPGWRMYFVQRGKVIIVMLGGGDKSTQQRDIAVAKRMAQRLED